MRGKLRLLVPLLVALAAGGLGLSAGAATSARADEPLSAPPPVKNKLPRLDEPVEIPPKAALRTVRESVVRIRTIRYRAHNGSVRRAYLILPVWYGPRSNPRIPLVISPHGRGVSALTNARLWRGLPGKGSFAVISPEGTGRELGRYSWGAVGQIDDLARMPTISRRALPWLRIDTRRIYALGGSMGGQETLLLLGRHPRLLAGAAAFDSVTDFARQYRSFPYIPCNSTCRLRWKGHIGKMLQGLARIELGGPPWKRPAKYAARSPITYARAIASSCVPLQLWWSRYDRIVANQGAQSGALFKTIRRLNPNAPVEAYVGFWSHSREMNAGARLPAALAGFGLLQPQPRRLTSGLHHTPMPERAQSCGKSAEAAEQATAEQETASAEPAPG